ncbi:MAG: hypothetical protein QM783_13305 [Phycisphaerales bacterium]
MVAELGLSEHSKIKIVESEENGVQVAFPVRWSDHFKEWSFIRMSSRVKPHTWVVGTCIEGVRVEFTAPGYRTSEAICAMANACGSRAPRTNVARSSIEAGADREKMLEAIYKAYCDHVKSEHEAMQKERGFSSTWASQEASFLMSALMIEGAVSDELLEGQVSRLAIVPVEADGARTTMTVEKIQSLKHFWTVNSLLLYHAESLIRETVGSLSLSSIIGVLGDALKLPTDPIVTSVPHALRQMIFAKREVDLVRIDVMQRRLDLRFGLIGDRASWYSTKETDRDVFEFGYSRRPLRSGDADRIRLAARAIPVEGDSPVKAVKSDGIWYLMYECELTQYLLGLIGTNSDSLPDWEQFLFPFAVIANYLDYHLPDVGMLRHIFSEVESQYTPTGFRFDRFLELLPTISPTFNPEAWDRDKPDGGD